MVIYLAFLVWQVVVACTEGGCTLSTPQHLNAILIAGLVELVIEIPKVISIYKRKMEDTEEDKTPMPKGK